MRNLKLVLCASVALLPLAPLPAYAVDTAVVVSSCSAIATISVGSTSGIFMDTTGHLCTNASATLSGLVGVKGADGTNIASAGNPLNVQDTNSAALLSAAQGAIPTTQSGTATAVTGCDHFATYDASDNGKKTVVTGVSAKKTYICGWMMGTGGTATNLTLGTGTGADCVTTFVAATPAWQLAANQRVGMNSPFYNGHALGNAADNVCVNASAGNAHQVLIYYTQY